MKHRNLIIAGVVGFFSGIVITMTIVWSSAAGLMLVEDVSSYSFDKSVALFEQSVNDHGWKIPAKHDLKKSMEKAGKSPIKNVTVFELCHPNHAHKILSLDKERIVSSLMPCRVAIYEKNDGKTYFSRMNSELMSKAMGGVIEEVMADAYRENEKIVSILTKK